MVNQFDYFTYRFTKIQIINFFYIFFRESKQPYNNILISLFFFAKSFLKKDNSIFLKGKLFNLQKNGCTDKIWLIELLNNLYNSIGSIELLPEIKLISLISY